MQTEENRKLVYGVKEAGEAINFSRAFLFEKIRTNEIRSFKIGAKRLIHAEDLSAFIEKHRGKTSHKVVA